MTTPSTVTLSFSGCTPLSAPDAKIMQGMVAAITGSMSAPAVASAPDATGASDAVTSAATATPAATTPTAAADPVAALTAKYFPDNIGLAAFPSPENSSIIRFGTVITGRPYLRDNSGNVHQFVQPTADCPNGYLMNGQPVRGGGSDGDPASSLLVRTGEVYVNVRGNIWQHISNGGLYTATLPAAFATDASGQTTSTVATSSVVAPPDPAPSATPPGSSGKVLEVGAGQTYATITAAFVAAQAGDTVHIAAGTYKETPPATLVPLYVKADKGAILDTTGLTTLARGKGAIVPAADMILEGLEIVGAGMTETEAGGTAGLTNVTITKPAGAYNHSVIDYATDDASAGNSGMQIVNSTIKALCDNPFMLIGSGSQITVDAATKAKTTGTITAQGGGTLVGL